MYNKIAVLYSFEQQCFHIETLERYCLGNIEASIRKTPLQFRLISICDTDEEASKIIDKFKNSYQW